MEANNTRLAICIHQYGTQHTPPADAAICKKRESVSSPLLKRDPALRQHPHRERSQRLPFQAERGLRSVTIKWGVKPGCCGERPNRVCIQPVTQPSAPLTATKRSGASQRPTSTLAQQQPGRSGPAPSGRRGRSGKRRHEERRTRRHRQVRDGGGGRSRAGGRSGRQGHELDEGQGRPGGASLLRSKRLYRCCPRPLPRKCGGRRHMRRGNTGSPGRHAGARAIQRQYDRAKADPSTDDDG